MRSRSKTLLFRSGILWKRRFILVVLAFLSVYNFFSCDSCSCVSQIIFNKVPVVLVPWKPRKLQPLSLKTWRAILVSCLSSPFATLPVKCLSARLWQSPPPDDHNNTRYPSDQEAADKEAWLLLPSWTTLYALARYTVPCKTAPMSGQETREHTCRCHAGRSLRRRYATACLLGLRVRVPPETWKRVSCDFCVFYKYRLLQGADG
jgi:hypothetical protein